MFSIFCLFLYVNKYYLLFNLLNQKLHTKAFSLKRKWKILFMYDKFYQNNERRKIKFCIISPLIKQITLFSWVMRKLIIEEKYPNIRCLPLVNRYAASGAIKPWVISTSLNVLLISIWNRFFNPFSGIQES